MTARFCRLLFSGAAILAVLEALAPIALAGSYQVRTCAAATGNVNSSWTFVQTGDSSKLQAGDGCSNAVGGEFSGLWVVDTLGSGVASNGEVSGFWTFTAPATTTITGMNYSRYLRTYSDQDWRSQARVASGATLESCTVPLDDPFCTLGVSGGATTSFIASPLPTTTLEVGVRCASGSPTTFCINGAGIHSAQATLYGATVTVNDPVAPAPESLTGGLFAGGWVRGTLSAQMIGSDATGISSLVLARDGSTIRTDTRSCDDRLAAPCAGSGASATSAWAAVATSLLSDGTHNFTGTIADAGGNTSSTGPVSVQTDNTAPIAPVGLTVQGGTWSTSATRTLDWTLPGGQAAPITGAEVEICKDGSGACFTQSATTTSSTIALPAPGTYTAAVKLEDAAGNVTVAPATVSLGYDTGAPPAPKLGAVEATGGDGYAVTVDTSNDPGPAPITGLAGEACPADGGACQTITPTGTPPNRATFALPKPGGWTIAVRAVDAAGNTSPSAATAYTVSSPPATPTPTPGPGPDPAPTETAAPTATPNPTPSATVTPARTRPALKLTRARLTRARIFVRGTLPENATGTVTMTLAARNRARRRTVKVKPGGTFTRTFALRLRQKGTRRARLTVAYGGDMRYLARTLRRRIAR